jgi:hypothetical protein
LVLADFVIQVEFEKTLRMAATRYDNRSRNKRKKKRGQFADTLGICHRFEQFSAAGQLDPLCAIVRLARPHLGVGIISHELVHAVVWMRELNEELDALTCANDEQFAWILGEVVRQTVDLMNECGVYDDAS